MVRHLVLEAEPTEPPIGKVELDLTTEPALGAERVAVADQKHPARDRPTGIPCGCRTAPDRPAASADRERHRSGATNDHVECVPRDRIRKTVDPVDQPPAPSL